MTYLDWNSAYESGNASIDYDYRCLMELLNEIHALIQTSAEPNMITDLLGQFYNLATAHFALEEKILRDNNCSSFAEQRHTHYRLLDQMRDIMDIYEAGARRRGESLPAALREWLLGTIHNDVQLFAQINKGRAPRPGLTKVLRRSPSS